MHNNLNGDCEGEQKLYERLYVANEDLGLAREYLQHLLKKTGTQRLGSVGALSTFSNLHL